MREQLTINSTSMGDYIRTLRQQKKYSQYFMANAIDISQNSYCLLENGRTNLNVERIVQIAAVFQLQAEEFFDGYFKYLHKS